MIRKRKKRDLRAYLWSLPQADEVTEQLMHARATREESRRKIAMIKFCDEILGS